jgi:hypothetical protein
MRIIMAAQHAMWGQLRSMRDHAVAALLLLHPRFPQPLTVLAL